jgi:glucose-6-phosphate 1-dehydrogenase
MNSLSIVVLGASGDLAHKKIYPALFALHCQGYLPGQTRIFGFARSSFDLAGFRRRISGQLTCRYSPGESCATKMAEFLEKCEYVNGRYDSVEDFCLLRERLAVRGPDSGVLVYFALPSEVFAQAASALSGAGFSELAEHGWLRAVMEKPFGRDRGSFDALMDHLDGVFSEDRIYRIDHYLGKEVIQNLMVLRFGNLIFEPVWSRTFVERVEVSWFEDGGVEERGRYFDSYGIIRDVMQNHLLQMVALIGLEQPLDIRNTLREEKVKLLRAVRPVLGSECVTGQYGPARYMGLEQKGYLEESYIAPDSLTPTYASCVLWINNRRWAGVPFVLKAGKACGRKQTEIRIHFKPVPVNPFECAQADLASNCLVVRVQPEEQIYLQVQNKKPGLDWRIVTRDLNLTYQAAFEEQIPDAYEALLLEVLKGDRSLFLRRDELEVSWDIFTPLLHELEATRRRPVIYPFGGEEPPEVQYSAGR